MQALFQKYLKNALAWRLTFLSGMLSLVFSVLLFFPGVAQAAEQAAPVLAAGVWQWGLLAAALSTGLSALGAGLAVASVGAAAAGSLAEKPELFGRLLILVGLAEGIAIYGLIIAILILNKLV